MKEIPLQLEFKAISEVTYLELKLSSHMLIGKKQRLKFKK